MDLLLYILGQWAEIGRIVLSVGFILLGFLWAGQKAIGRIKNERKREDYRALFARFTVGLWICLAVWAVLAIKMLKNPGG